MKKVFKLMSRGSLFALIAATVICFSGCIAKSTNVSLNEDIASKMDTANYDDYKGSYELAPNFIIKVTKEGDSLYTQATGQQKFKIYPESEDKFYLKVVAAKIKFNRNTEGRVESMTLYQNGQQVPGKKLNI